MEICEKSYNQPDSPKENQDCPCYGPGCSPDYCYCICHDLNALHYQCRESLKEYWSLG